MGERLNCSGNRIGQQFTDTIMRQTWQGSQENPFVQNVITAFISQATLSIYRQWVADGKKIPLEDIIKLTTRLICNGINQIQGQNFS